MKKNIIRIMLFIIIFISVLMSLEISNFATTIKYTYCPYCGYTLSSGHCLKCKTSPTQNDYANFIHCPLCNATNSNVSSGMCRSCTEYVYTWEESNNEDTSGLPSSTSQSTIEGIFSGADDFLGKGESINDVINDTNLQKTSRFMYKLLLAMGIVVAFIVGTILGIQFITSGSEDKAKIKEALVPYIVGCCVIFGGFTIWGKVVNIGQDIMSNTTADKIEKLKNSKFVFIQKVGKGDTKDSETFTGPSSDELQSAVDKYSSISWGLQNINIVVEFYDRFQDRTIMVDIETFKNDYLDKIKADLQ